MNYRHPRAAVAFRVRLLRQQAPALLMSAPVVAITPFTNAELHEVRDERYRLEHSHLCELTVAGPQLTTFPIPVLISTTGKECAWISARSDE